MSETQLYIDLSSYILMSLLLIIFEIKYKTI